jgi:hypothetical protein
MKAVSSETVYGQVSAAGGWAPVSPRSICLVFIIHEYERIIKRYFEKKFFYFGTILAYNVMRMRRIRIWTPSQVRGCPAQPGLSIGENTY